MTSVAASLAQQALYTLRPQLFHQKWQRPSRKVQNPATPRALRATRSLLAASEGAAERPLWLPGLLAPEYLNGTLAGDFGFDPLRLGEDPEELRWYVQAELVHSRFAMAGVAGMLVTDILRVSGLKQLPVWFEAGAAEYELSDAATLFVIQMLLFQFVELKRYMDFKVPGSQGRPEAVFFGMEAAFRGMGNGYPGGPIFNPFGFEVSTKKALPMQWREIRNGRLAMVAAVGFFVQAAVTKQGPVENLLAHLADPWHHTIIQTLSQ